ncbi:hypothetical protein HYR99_19625 [Candidatus Poribacteria bacterium]|nr:hypothetical protein [Candidatus Poribacteria bacterium]
MTYPAVVDSSTLIALVRGGIHVHLGQFFQPLFIGSGAEKECRQRPQIDVALTQAANALQLTVVNLISRSRAYNPNLSPEDIEGIEIALARSAVLLTQDDLQEIEALNAGVQVVLGTFDLLEGFKRRGVIPLICPVLEQMERKGEHYPRSEKNRLLRRVNERPIP